MITRFEDDIQPLKASGSQNHKKQDKSNALICYPKTIPEICPDSFFLAILFQMMVVSSSSRWKLQFLCRQNWQLTLFSAMYQISLPKISAKYFQNFCLVMLKQSVDKLKQGFCLTWSVCCAIFSKLTQIYSHNKPNLS